MGNISKDEKIKREETKNAELAKENKELKKNNKEIEGKIDQLANMVQNLLEQQEKQKEEYEKQKEQQEKQKEETANIAEKRYKEIDPTERVLLMHMVNAGGTYITHTGKAIRLEGFGSFQSARFEDVESLISKYRKKFDNLEIKIIEPQSAIDALYLRKQYDKYDISKEEMEDIINLEPQDMIKKIKSLPKSLQESAISLIIEGVAKNDKKYMDKNKWDVINSAFKIDIKSLVDRYFVN